jgi:exopolysaccharide production protein ExoY
MLGIDTVVRASKEAEPGQPAVGGQIKRTFDIVTSSLILLGLAPLFFFLAVLVKLIDPGPIIYRHWRVGRKGQGFTCFKFRTMFVDSENRLKLLLEADPVVRGEWDRNRKLKKDPRVTPFGLILRKSSADELPQLLNVLRGEMSLVGPRPVVPEELARYGPRVNLYLSSRPGITGSWQISGRSDCDYDKRIELDTDYVSNWHFSTDLFILVRTVGAVIKRKGSY